MSLDARIQSLVANFREQLSEALRESNGVSSMSPAAKILRSSHGRNTSNVVANDSGIGTDNTGEEKALSETSVSFLVQLWQQTGELARSLSGRTVGTSSLPEEEESRSSSPDLDESLRQAVIVMGPPGTEPKHGLSEGRFDRSESIVYKRNIVHVSLPRQAPTPKVRRTVPKDTPRPPLEVFMCPRIEDDFENRRWTRAGARAIEPFVMYAEDSESSNQSDMSDVRSKAHTSTKHHRNQVHTSAKHHRNQVRTSAKQHRNQAHTSVKQYHNQERKQRHNPVRETLISNEPVSINLGSDLEASPPKPLDSSTPMEEVGGSPKLSALDSSPDPVEPDDEMEPDYEIDWEPVIVPDSTMAAISRGKKPLRLSVGSGTDVSETPLSSPSGILTVLSDLRHSFPLAKKQQLAKMSARVKQKAVGSSSIPIRAAPRPKPCSVLVERLPWKVVVECMRRQHAQKLAAKNHRPVDRRSTPGSSGYPSSLKMKLAREVTTPVSAKNNRKLQATPTNRTPIADWSSDSDFELGRPSSSQSSVSKRTPLVDGVRVVSASSGSRGRGLVQATMDSFVKTSEPVKQRAETSGVTPIKLPDVINCTACGTGIQWKVEKIHEHQQLRVLICQHCWKKYNTGNFTVEDGSEIYCTLCGDGGEMVCCDCCEKSLCIACIQRVSGEQVLQGLLSDETLEWKCYVCDPSPLAKERKACTDLCNYYKQKMKAKRSLVFQSSGGESSDGGGQGSRGSPPTSSSGYRGGGSGSSGCGDGKSSSGCGDGKSSSGRGEGKSSSGRGDGKSSSGRGEGKSSSGRGDGKSSSGRGDGKSSRTGKDGKTGSGNKKTSSDLVSSQKKKFLLPGDSDTEDSSSAESMEVQTDDVSMSDSDFLSELPSGVRRKRKKRCATSTSASNNSGIGGNPQVTKEEALPVGSGGLDRVSSNAKRKKSAKSRLRNFALFSSDSDFESPVVSSPPRKKKRNLSSGEDSDVIMGFAKKTSKKSRLAGILSSASESEQEVPQNYQFEFSNGGIESDFDAPESDPILNLDRSIKYATRKGSSGSSSDSDSDIIFLGRKKKFATQQRVIFSDRGSETAGSNDDTVKTKPAWMFRERPAKSTDDFEKDFSRLGPRIKKRKAKRAVWDSDSSSEDEAGIQEEPKSPGEENEESGEEHSQEGSQDKGTSGRKRKKIRKLIANAKLNEKTREAQRLERERRDRLKKKAKATADMDDSERLILEQDSDTKEVQVEVRRSLLEPIMPHQRQGIKFLYDSCVETLERLRSGERSGAILAHCMGLGKTLQVIAFLDALLRVEESGIQRVIVLAPVNALHNWRNEFERWIPYDKCDYNLFMLTDVSTAHRHRKLECWFNGGGILFSGYDMFRNLAQGKNLKKQKRKQQDFQKFLLDPGPDIIVCDEGHVMRNSKSNLSQVLGRVRTRCRVILTGTPLQNNLLEYYTMVNFVKPNLLGTMTEFKNRFVNPIMNGQCRDSTPHDVRRMKLRAHVLHEMLAGSVQRRDYRVLAECLPPKQEYVLAIRLSPLQDQLYRRFLEHGGGMHTQQDLFSTFANLSKVWNHPWVLKLSEYRERERAGLESEEEDDTSLGGFIVSEGSDVEEERIRADQKKKRRKGRPPSTSTSRSTTPADDVIVIGDDSGSPSSSGDTEWNLASHLTKQPSGSPKELVDSTSAAAPDSSNAPGPSDVKPKTRSPTPNASGPSHIQPKTRSPTPNGPWYHDLITRDIEGDLELSGKLQFLLGLLEEAEQLKEKVLVFTQSLLTLDLIESMLNNLEDGEWTPGLDYYRLDGSTKADIRCSYMSDFNSKNNDRMRLFLISTRAGSLGVNLVAANRVVIFDACWNPSHDLQAIFRTYRFGQTKPIFVYRLLAKGTMEEKIYDRQVTKQSLSMRVVDEKQIGRHFTTSELQELFTYSPAPPPDTQRDDPQERPQADMVLCSLLDKMQPQWIVSYHEHDSLLEHVFDEELSEEDRKAAWENYKSQMAAESKSYNMQALQSRLEEQMAGQGTLTSTVVDHSTGSSIIRMLQNSVQNVREMMQLQQNYRHLSYQAQHPDAVHAKRELARVGSMMSEGYRKVAEGIEQVNNYLMRVNSGQITLPPDVTRTVNAFRQYLITELERFERLSNNQAPGLNPHVSSTTPHTGPRLPSRSQPAPFQATSLPLHGMGPHHSRNHHYHVPQAQNLQSHSNHGP